jgi:hypothetical protein
MMAMRQNNSTAGRPQFAAVHYKESDGSTGHRLEILLHPTPDAAYTLNYRYEAFASKLTALAPYPLGGMKFSEVIIESCLSVAEQRANGERGVHWESFGRLLVSAVAQDQKSGAKCFGQIGDPGDGAPASRRDFGSNYPITYKGDTW